MQIAQRVFGRHIMFVVVCVPGEQCLHVIGVQCGDEGITVGGMCIQEIAHMPVRRIGWFVDEGEVVRLPIGRQIVADPGVQGGHDVAICGSIAASAGVPIPVCIDGYKVSVLVSSRSRWS